MTAPEIVPELLPCPFPHEIKRGPFVERDGEDFFFVRVSCGDCGCAGPYVPLDSKDGKAEKAEAIRLWNTRARLAAVRELVEALKLIKLACLGTSTADGWRSDRILSCVTRLCIDAGITESYSVIGTERRYAAITEPVGKIGNRVRFSLGVCQWCNDGCGWYTSYSGGVAHWVPCDHCNYDGLQKPDPRALANARLSQEGERG